MSQAKRAALHHPAPEIASPPEGRPLTKVYWSGQEKAAFQQEARDHNQKESEYARFILTARKDPVPFLQYRRLRDPGFARGLTGNPADAGRVAELEKRVVALDRRLLSASRGVLRCAGFRRAPQACA
ncbi:MAG TPA: hypothetical protein VHH36_01720 [Candidatus Thermoplasmatota archaeon]|nr:hypothetical protein [Candidatus Thermoplasmatota archaeon]